jgi:hypothetical protein
VCKCLSRRNKILQHMECDRKCSLPNAVHSVHLCSFVVFWIILTVPVYHFIKLSCQRLTIFVKIKMYPKMFLKVSVILNLPSSPIGSEFDAYRQADWLGLPYVCSFYEWLAKNDIIMELGLCSVYRMACLVTYILLYCSTSCILWRLFTTNVFRRLCWRRGQCCLLQS